MVCASCQRKITLADALCPGCGRLVVADMRADDQSRRAAARSPAVKIVVAVSVMLVAFVGGGSYLAFRKASARTHELAAMRTIQTSADAYRADHPGECPTVTRLLDEKEISSMTRIRDGWGELYVIECVPDETRVRSSGPDRVRGTADDLVMPLPPGAGAY